jgi:phosphatidate cytidylyltransferase
VAIPLAIFAIVVVWTSEDVLMLAAIAVGLISMHELYRMLGPVNPVPVAGFAGLIGLCVAARFGDQFQMVLVLALTFLLTFLLVIARADRRHPTLAIAGTLLGVLWIGLSLSHGVLLRGLEHGDALLFDVLLATFIGDTSAYFGGRLWGTRPLAPRISPGKTLEGLIAGFVAGTMAFWFAGLYQNWLAGIDALVIGACVAAVAPLGDLFESMIKRDLGVKDAGRTLGEHGGMLDRLDAMFFTLVMGYYVSLVVL